jgi:hypothetical protein
VTVDDAGLEDANLTSFQVVILANVYRLSQPAVESLERFTRQGGGVILFLGDQVDADLYNGGLYREGGGLLPASLTEVIAAAEEAHLVVNDRLHPAMQGLSREGDPLGIGRIPFFKYFGCVPYSAKSAEGSERDTATQESPTGAEPGAASRGPARVIARFDDATESPAIVERPFGAGRVVMVTTSADKEWHQWPDHPSFLPAMMELVHYVTPRAGSPVDHRVGDRIEWPIDVAAFEPDAMVRTPAYPAEQEVSLTAAPSADSRSVGFAWEHTETSGLYQFVFKRREGGETMKLFAVNVDPHESDLAGVSEEELRAALRGVPFDYVHGLDKLAGAAGEARTEWWRFFLVAAAVLLMSEQTLAWWWGRRR